VRGDAQYTNKNMISNRGTLHSALPYPDLVTYPTYPLLYLPLSNSLWRSRNMRSQPFGVEVSSTQRMSSGSVIVVRRRLGLVDAVSPESKHLSAANRPSPLLLPISLSPPRRATEGSGYPCLTWSSQENKRANIMQM